MKKFHSILLIHSLLLLYGFGGIKASVIETLLRDELYKKYFKQQEKIYQELLDLGISGVRPLEVDEVLAEEVIANCPQEIKDAISSIEQSVFLNEKNTILHGMSGTGKSCLAQAIAVKSQTPCLFFNAGDISTEYMNSGVQNLNRIFKYAKMLERTIGKPCVIIFDELEALTKKHAGTNNHENNILISFWQRLDTIGKSRIVVIGTMNGTEDLPVQITNRTSMIEIPLPKPEHREVILSYYLKANQDKYKLMYPESVTAASLARQTKGFSNRDLQKLVDKAIRPVILVPAVPDKSNKIVTSDYFARVIKQIKKDPKRKLEREIGTWKHTFKKHFRDPWVLTVAGLTATMVIAYNAFSLQKKSISLQERSISIQERGLEQSQKIADRLIAGEDVKL